MIWTSSKAVTGKPDEFAGLKRNALIYALSLGLVALTLIVRFVLAPTLGGQALYLFLVPPVLVAGVIGGIGPGLVTTAISLVLHLYLTGEVASLAHADLPLFASELWRAVTFTALGVGIAWFGELLQQTRRQAAAREAHLQSILDTVPDAMIVIDECGLINSFSAAAERLFGYSPQEAIGQNVKILMPPPYHDDHDGYIERYLSDRRAEDHRHRPRRGRPAQGRLDLSHGARRRRDALIGTARFFTGFIRDLTERQEAEARLQELQSELVHISRLTALGEMASTLAHELNQPLSAIANYLKGSRRLLAARTDDQSRMIIEAMDKAADQSLRAGEIIRRLRDFVARGETERRIESLNKLIEEASALALVGARDRGVRVTYRFRSRRRPRAGRQGADPAGRAQPDAQRHRGHGGIAAPRADDRDRARTRRHGAVKRRRYRDRRRPRDRIAAVSAVRHQQAARHGRRPVDLAHHRRGAWRAIWVEPNPGGGTMFHFTLRAVSQEDLRDDR